MLVSQLFEIFTILKYVDLDLQSTAEIEENIISYFGEYFRILCNNPKTFDFLGSFLNTLPEPKQLELMRHFFINCHQLRNDALLFNFLDKNIGKIPVNDSLINPSLWSCSAGCLLGLFLVLKNNKILEAVLNSFLNSEIFDCEYLHRFVDILASLCNDKQKAEVKKKLKSAKIFHPEDAPLQK
ncbi:uncharacterized protein VICG_00268 [Vittaforma corneae ATCC 50505]|uniref:Uncharacterized protein n=1 Tax=Vittaforma corneae (strain ATCC 50505) TaxID=993615 RepID=L2GPX8_VITCO|nr:uncharacterized protein VICG_00268 [Vittaforma corneae ATCC 50505]ELA42953.1 hypothetical protein VICG_00268 [Vittaforma corneae ATCC 50505]